MQPANRPPLASHFLDLASSPLAHVVGKTGSESSYPASTASEAHTSSSESSPAYSPEPQGFTRLGAADYSSAPSAPVPPRAPQAGSTRPVDPPGPAPRGSNTPVPRQASLEEIAYTSLDYGASSPSSPGAPSISSPPSAQLQAPLSPSQRRVAFALDSDSGPAVSGMGAAQLAEQSSEKLASESSSQDSPFAFPPQSHSPPSPDHTWLSSAPPAAGLAPFEPPSFEHQLDSGARGSGGGFGEDPGEEDYPPVVLTDGNFPQQGVPETGGSAPESEPEAPFGTPPSSPPRVRVGVRSPSVGPITQVLQTWRQLELGAGLTPSGTPSPRSPTTPGSSRYSRSATRSDSKVREIVERYEQNTPREKEPFAQRQQDGGWLDNSESSTPSATPRGGSGGGPVAGGGFGAGSAEPLAPAPAQPAPSEAGPSAAGGQPEGLSTVTSAIWSRIPHSEEGQKAAAGAGAGAAAADAGEMMHAASEADAEASRRATWDRTQSMGSSRDSVSMRELREAHDSNLALQARLEEMQQALEDSQRELTLSENMRELATQQLLLVEASRGEEAGGDQMTAMATVVKTVLQECDVELHWFRQKRMAQMRGEPIPAAPLSQKSVIHTNELYGQVGSPMRGGPAESPIGRVPASVLSTRATTSNFGATLGPRRGAGRSAAPVTRATTMAAVVPERSRSPVAARRGTDPEPRDGGSAERPRESRPAPFVTPAAAASPCGRSRPDAETSGRSHARTDDAHQAEFYSTISVGVQEESGARGNERGAASGGWEVGREGAAGGEDGGRREQSALLTPTGLGEAQLRASAEQEPTGDGLQAESSLQDVWLAIQKSPQASAPRSRTATGSSDQATSDMLEASRVQMAASLSSGGNYGSPRVSSQQGARSRSASPRHSGLEAEQSSGKSTPSGHGRSLPSTRSLGKQVGSAGVSRQKASRPAENPSKAGGVSPGTVPAHMWGKGLRGAAPKPSPAAKTTPLQGPPSQGSHKSLRLPVRGKSMNASDPEPLTPKSARTPRTPTSANPKTPTSARSARSARQAPPWGSNAGRLAAAGRTPRTAPPAQFSATSPAVRARPGSRAGGATEPQRGRSPIAATLRFDDEPLAADTVPADSRKPWRPSSISPERVRSENEVLSQSKNAIMGTTSRALGATAEVVERYMAAPQTMNAAAFAGKLRQDDLSMSPPRAESPLRYSDRSPQGASGERTLLVEADSYFGTDERPAARAESPAASRGNTRATAPAAPGAAVDQPGSAGGSDNRRSSGLAAVRTRPTTPSRSSSPMSSFTAKGTQKGVIWSGTVSPSRWAGNLRAQDDVVAQVSGATKQETARLRQQARAELARESYENFLQNQNQAENLQATSRAVTWPAAHPAGPKPSESASPMQKPRLHTVPAPVTFQVPSASLDAGQAPTDTFASPPESPGPRAYSPDFDEDPLDPPLDPPYSPERSPHSRGSVGSAPPRPLPDHPQPVPAPAREPKSPVAPARELGVNEAAGALLSGIANDKLGDSFRMPSYWQATQRRPGSEPSASPKKPQPPANLRSPLAAGGSPKKPRSPVAAAAQEIRASYPAPGAAAAPQPPTEPSSLARIIAAELSREREESSSPLRAPSEGMGRGAASPGRDWDVFERATAAMEAAAKHRERRRSSGGGTGFPDLPAVISPAPSPIKSALRQT